MQIRELMNQPVWSCRSSDTLDAAARLMWEQDCGSIAITDDEGKLVGMVTDRDICMATYTKGSPPHAIRVSDVMAERVLFCRANDSLAKAEALMGDAQIRRVPVVDDEHRPIGMLSLGDLVRYAASRRDNGTKKQEVLSTLAAICAPRTLLPVATRQPETRHAS